MSWAAVPTHLMDLREWRALTNDAQWLWLAGRLHAASVESDGMLDETDLPALLMRARVTTSPDKLFAELEAKGWWKRVDDGWLDVHFLEDNATHEQRQHTREQAAERKRRQRERSRHAVTEPHVTRDQGDVSRVTKLDVTRHREEEEEEVQEHRTVTDDSVISPELEQFGRVRNGSVNAMYDAGRAERIRGDLVSTVETCRVLRGKAKERWRSWVDEMVRELTARSDLSESTIRRRAREFFLIEHWVDLGDSSQASNLRERLFKPVKTKRTA